MAGDPFEVGFAELHFREQPVDERLAVVVINIVAFLPRVLLPVLYYLFCAKLRWIK